MAQKTNNTVDRVRESKRTNAWLNPENKKWINNMAKEFDESFDVVVNRQLSELRKIEKSSGGEIDFKKLLQLSDDNYIELQKHSAQTGKPIDWLVNRLLDELDMEFIVNPRSKAG